MCAGYANCPITMARMTVLNTNARMAWVVTVRRMAEVSTVTSVAPNVVVAATEKYT